MKLYLVRHGFAYHNLAAHIQGDKAYNMSEFQDAHLTPDGILQAQDLRKVLNAVTFNTIYCSSLTRCIQTCDNCVTTDLIVKLDDRLMEPQGHHICNKRKDKEEVKKFIQNLNNRYELYNVKEDYDGHINNPEKGKEVLERINSFITEIVKKHKSTDKVLVVSHHDWLYHFFQYVIGKPYKFNNCELKIIELA